MNLSGIFRLPRALVRGLGYDVVRYSEALTSANAWRLRVLKDNRVDVVLDVGASEGNFGEKVRQSGYTGKIVSFEPLADSYERLLAVSQQDGAWQAVHTAIGDHDGDDVDGYRDKGSVRFRGRRQLT
jgi:hypothetical protein